MFDSLNPKIKPSGSHFDIVPCVVVKIGKYGVEIDFKCMHDTHNIRKINLNAKLPLQKLLPPEKYEQLKKENQLDELDLLIRRALKKYAYKNEDSSTGDDNLNNDTNNDSNVSTEEDKTNTTNPCADKYKDRTPEETDCAKEKKPETQPPAPPEDGKISAPIKQAVDISLTFNANALNREGYFSFFMRIDNLDDKGVFTIDELAIDAVNKYLEPIDGDESGVKKEEMIEVCKSPVIIDSDGSSLSCNGVSRNIIEQPSMTCEVSGYEIANLEKRDNGYYVDWKGRNEPLYLHIVVKIKENAKSFNERNVLTVIKNITLKVSFTGESGQKITKALETQLDKPVVYTVFDKSETVTQSLNKKLFMKAVYCSEEFAVLRNIPKAEFNYKNINYIVAMQGLLINEGVTFMSMDVDSYPYLSRTKDGVLYDSAFYNFGVFNTEVGVENVVNYYYDDKVKNTVSKEIDPIVLVKTDDALVLHVDAMMHKNSNNAFKIKTNTNDYVWLYKKNIVKGLTEVSNNIKYFSKILPELYEKENSYGVIHSNQTLKFLTNFQVSAACSLTVQMALYEAPLALSFSLMGGSGIGLMLVLERIAYAYLFGILNSIASHTIGEGIHKASKADMHLSMFETYTMFALLQKTEDREIVDAIQKDMVEEFSLISSHSEKSANYVAFLFPPLYVQTAGMMRFSPSSSSYISNYTISDICNPDTNIILTDELRWWAVEQVCRLSHINFKTIIPSYLAMIPSISARAPIHMSRKVTDMENKNLLQDILIANEDNKIFDGRIDVSDVKNLNEFKNKLIEFKSIVDSKGKNKLLSHLIEVLLNHIETTPKAKIEDDIGLLQGCCLENKDAKRKQELLEGVMAMVPYYYYLESGKQININDFVNLSPAKNTHIVENKKTYDANKIRVSNNVVIYQTKG